MVENPHLISLINFWKEMTGVDGISFFWAMPLCFVAQAIVGPLASLVPIGKKRMATDEHG